MKRRNRTIETIEINKATTTKIEKKSAAAAAPSTVIILSVIGSESH